MTDGSARAVELTAAQPGFFSKHALQGVLPIEHARVPMDIVAGITLAALAIPEVMGYTSIAGTPVVTGLYTILLPIARLRLVRLLAPPGGRRRFRDRGDPGGGRWSGWPRRNRRITWRWPRWRP